MVTKELSEISSDRQKWDKIFNGLVRMLKTQQTQLVTLVNDRKILEDRIKMQHERWASDISLYEDHICEVIPFISSKIWFFIFFLGKLGFSRNLGFGETKNTKFEVFLAISSVVEGRFGNARENTLARDS